MSEHDDWLERAATLSVHPDSATRDDVARLAAELMEANARIIELTDARNLLARRLVALGHSPLVAAQE